MDIKPAENCHFDIVSLGEVMLRLDPGSGRVRTARSFDVWEGGGEYNVARGMSRCFGMRAALVSAFVDNQVGRLLETLISAGGVDTTNIIWRDFDGIGRRVRNGLNFTERGFGLRAAQGTSDRGHTAASQLKPGDIDWEKIFGKIGVRWFHTGGIFAGLSETTPEVVKEALLVAKRHGTVTSYDLNYRDSLWNDFGGKSRCQQVNREIAPLVDVMIGNEEDFSACLGLQSATVDDELRTLPVESYKTVIARVVDEFPNLQVIATTLRTVKTATINDWSALCWFAGEIHQAAHRENLEIFDRVGGGDSFASGLIYGFMATGDAQMAVDFGTAHGALAMTTPGDNSMATLDEIKSLVSGKSARVKR